MSTHETVVHSETIEPGSDRQFGLVVGGVLCAIGAYLLLTGSDLHMWFFGSGVLLVLFGLFLPKPLHPLNVGWTLLGVLLGRIITPIVMFLVYAITIIPIGIALRLSGKDLLSLKKGEVEPTYWIERSPPGPSPESLKDQF